MFFTWRCPRRTESGLPNLWYSWRQQQSPKSRRSWLFTKNRNRKWTPDHWPKDSHWNVESMRGCLLCWPKLLLHALQACIGCIGESEKPRPCLLASLCPTVNRLEAFGFKQLCLKTCFLGQGDDSSLGKRCHGMWSDQARLSLCDKMIRNAASYASSLPRERSHAWGRGVMGCTLPRFTGWSNNYGRGQPQRCWISCNSFLCHFQSLRTEQDTVEGKPWILVIQLNP